MTKTNGATAILASAVFLKIQEFQRRPVTEQVRLRAQLEVVIAVTTADLAPTNRLVLDASDGAAVVVLRDPEGALRVAERALTAAAGGLPLSGGVNHGAVQLAGAGKGDDGMIGDGIAVAASIAEFASPSRLLVSRAFRDALADAAPGQEACLVPAGVLTDPGLRSHELFSPDRSEERRRSVRFLALSATAAVVFLAAGIGYRISIEGQEKFLDRSSAYAASVLGKLKFWESSPASSQPSGSGRKTARDKSRG
jgi:hypothetical protein